MVDLHILDHLEVQNKTLEGRGGLKSSFAVNQDILRTIKIERRIKMTLIINQSSTAFLWLPSNMS